PRRAGPLSPLAGRGLGVRGKSHVPLAPCLPFRYRPRTAGGGRQPAPQGMANASSHAFLDRSPLGEDVGNAGTDDNFAGTRGTDMRDHRDAKAMAKTLRETLAARNIDITHSEAL